MGHSLLHDNHNRRFHQASGVLDMEQPHETTIVDIYSGLMNTLCFILLTLFATDGL